MHKQCHGPMDIQWIRGQKTIHSSMFTILGIGIQYMEMPFLLKYLKVEGKF